MSDFDSDDILKGMGMTFAAVLVVGLLGLMFLYGAWAGAFVGVHLWNWFVLPVFPSMPALTLPQVFGVALLIGYWTHTAKIDGCVDDRETSAKVVSYISAIIFPWEVLFIGWMCHHFFMK